MTTQNSPFNPPKKTSPPSGKRPKNRRFPKAPKVKSSAQPSILRQKRKGGADTAFVIIDGRRIYLGIYGTPKAQKEYHRIVAEWNNNFIAPTKNTENITIAELVLRFLQEREKNVSPSQWDAESRVGDVLVSIYGDRNTGEFDINCLRTVRNVFVQKGYVRQKINWRVRIVQFIFRWGASYKIAPASVYHELKTLIPLKKGEFGLPESQQRKTVPLTPSQFDFERNRFAVLAATTKNKRPDILPIRSELIGKPKKWIEERNITSSERIFSYNKSSIRRSFYADLAAAGIERKSPDGRSIDVHSLRRTFGTMLARAGVPLTTTQRLMRYSTPELTAKLYIDVEPIDMMQAVEKLPRFDDT